MNEIINHYIIKSVKHKGLWVDFDKKEHVLRYLSEICNIKYTKKNVGKLLDEYYGSVKAINVDVLKVKKYFVKTSHGTDVFYARRKSAVISFVMENYVDRYGGRVSRDFVLRIVSRE